MESRSVNDDELQSMDLSVPLPSEEMDQMRGMEPSGGQPRQSREDQIIHNYETDNVGINVPAPKSGNLGFKLQLLDSPVENFSRSPHW